MSGELWTYERAGVSLSKHRSLHQIALSIARSLNEKLSLEVEGLGGYATSLKHGDSKLILHVDGVGTKTLVLRDLDAMWVAGWDCVAVNVNDVACERGKPLALVDYIAMPTADDRSFSQIMEGLARAGLAAKVGLLGGETAIMPDLVAGIDVVCTLLAVRTGDVREPDEGDIIVGVESWGLHANGYTLVRRILRDKGLRYDSIVDGVDLKVELSKPTAIYSNLLLEAYERGLAKTAAHITGGGYAKMRRMLGSRLDAVIKPPEPPRVFDVIRRLGGVPVEEMYRVFNMGVGLVVATSRDKVDDMISLAEKHGFKATVIGSLARGSGRIIVETHRGEKFEL